MKIQQDEQIYEHIKQTGDVHFRRVIPRLNVTLEKQTHFYSSTRWKRWMWVVPSLTVIMMMTVIGSLLLSTTQGNQSFPVVYQGLTPLNQVTYPTSEERTSMEADLGSFIQEDLIELNHRVNQQLLSAWEHSESVVFSPLTTMVTLITLLEGMHEEPQLALSEFLSIDDIGVTRTMIEQVMINLYNNSEDNPLNPLTSKLIQGLFIPLNQSLQPQLVDRFTHHYFTDIFATIFDTSIQQSMNQWASEQTFGQVIDVFQPYTIEASTLSILFTYLLFNNRWVQPFDETFTYQGTFYNQQSSQFVSVPYLVKPSASIRTYASSTYTAYSDLLSEGYQMVYVLPQNDQTVASILQNNEYSQILHSLQNEGTMLQTHFHVPELSLTSVLNLQDALFDKGIVATWNHQSHPFMEPISETSVQELYQHHQLVLNAQGVHAESIDSTQPTAASPSIDESMTIINESFLYFLIDSQGLILYSGWSHQP
jgi:serine protease inhibitor